MRPARAHIGRVVLRGRGWGAACAWRVEARATPLIRTRGEDVYRASSESVSDGCRAFHRTLSSSLARALGHR